MKDVKAKWGKMEKFDKNHPDVEPQRLSEFFSVDRAFKIPSYQREYAWDEHQIDDLCVDLLTFANSTEPYYMLGQAILAENAEAGSDDYPLAVVDGQQRLTSLYLMFIALRDLLKTVEVSEKDLEVVNDAKSYLESCLLAIDVSNGSKRPRLLLTEFGQTHLERLLKGQSLPEIDMNSTQINIRENFTYMKDFFAKNLTDAKTISQFVRKVIYQVFIIRTILAEVDQALEIFEKLNNRGRRLNSADLLKNLLFQKTDPEDFEKISKQWESSVENVFKVKPNKAASMEYLMKSLLGERIGAGVPNKGVYKAWKSEFDGKNEEPVKFSEALGEAAKFISMVGTEATNAHNKYLIACRYFGTVQHFPLAVAGRKIFKENQTHFQLLNKIIDTRILLSLFSEEKSQLLDAAIWPWSQKIAGLKGVTESEILDSAKDSFENQYDLLDAAKLNFSKLRYDKPRDLRRIRFVLARISHSLQVEALEASLDSTHEDLLTPKKGLTGYHVDHIMPKSVMKGENVEDNLWVHGIGNLVLLHAKDNMSAGAVNPDEKSLDYRNSKLILTQALSKKADLVDLNPRIAGVISKARDLGHGGVDDWSPDAAMKREEYLWARFEETLKLEALIS